MDDVTISKGEISRRAFVKLALATGITTSVAAHTLAAEKPVNEMPRPTLGDAGGQVSCLGLGGRRKGSESQSLGIIRNGWDNCHE